MPEVVIKGTKIHYIKANAKIPNPGNNVLFIHGSGGNAFMWNKVMDGLTDVSESLAVSLPGHGESRGEGMKSVLEYREFLKDFLDALKLDNVVLAGHSLGGAIVLDFALHYPGKLKAIILIGTGARLRVLPDALEILRKMADGQIEPKFEPWAFADNASPEVLAEGEREWARTSSRVRYHDMAACDKFDIMEGVGKISLPALIVCGRQDRLTPVKYSEFLNKKIAGSKMEIIEGAGHMLMIEEPQQLSGAILNFLKEL
ncbi:MAG: alpha/beta hydrolase [Deltaproteobacteria bacterium]|nr:alpha/beta hydrolase [Deltaproteobacteria bacterium]